MQYNFKKIEEKWQRYWATNQTFKASNHSHKPKYYVLDMFPYPSGAGLHVGHPLGYIASDIYARYKRHKGFNVLHPQGYDSFGLPAEQYAIQTGQHPAKTIQENIATYRKQLDKIGFSFDWSREVRTSDPNYYRWTQWIFIQLFNSWYNKNTDKAEDISTLLSIFKNEGNATVNAVCSDDITTFSASQWQEFSSKQQQQILLQYRLTYLSDTEVNWCSALGTVLANDEIINGVSERGGHTVIRKKMTQWSMRITAYAQRLLDGLETIDWPQPLKDIQTNWIGRSQGAMISFKVKEKEAKGKSIDVFTTRPDTIFGVSFITLAPEHDLVSKITTDTQKNEVKTYIEATSKRSERDRMADVKTISGVFTGAYAVHPFTKKQIPIWIGDYVLANYGTGAVMAVPCGDQRDYDFAKYFTIDIPNIFKNIDISEKAHTDKESTTIENSYFLNGLSYKKAMKRVIYEMEKHGFGKEKINYRLRDAVFSRQRYWGEPFPVYYKNGMPQMIEAQYLPIVLPKVEKYLPTEEGKPPLGNAKTWAWNSIENAVVDNELIDNKTIFPLELNTMPGWVGSSWYFNRYMDADNTEEFVSKKAVDYWKEIDLYIGGSEHATGHLLYARFWQKFLFDKDFVPVDEFAKKLINQGMILGTSAFVYRVVQSNLEVSFTPTPTPTATPIEYERDLVSFVSRVYISDLSDTRGNIIQRDSFIEGEKMQKILNEMQNSHIYKIQREYSSAKNIRISEPSPSYYSIGRINVDVSFVNSSDELNIEAFKNWRSEFNDATFIGENEQIIDNENGIYKVVREVEKMSKSKYNVVNPDTICEQYGADSLRLFEMFLGPLEQSKPWKTAGISGVHNFLKKLWKLYHANETFTISEEEPTNKELKTLHKTIKKVEEDIEIFSFNTSVSTFMIAVNELTTLKCNKRKILEPLLVLISPYAPHIAEELWHKLGYETSISEVPFPKFEEAYLVESIKNYPISFNGKMRFTLELPLNMNKDEIEDIVLNHKNTQAQLQGRIPKKVIVVLGKIVNIVG